MWRCRRHSGQADDSAEGRISLRLKLARPGIQENQKLLDTRFRGYDGGALLIYFANFSSRTLVQYYGSAHAFRLVCGYSDAGVLCARGSQPLVCPRLRCILCVGIGLRVSSRGLALWTGGGYLVFRRVATLVAANGLGRSIRGEVNNLFKVT